MAPEGLRALARQAEECATFYEGSRGLVGPETVIDLYRAIARLARLCDSGTDPHGERLQAGCKP